jgi:hypothetical protein
MRPGRGENRMLQLCGHKKNGDPTGKVQEFPGANPTARGVPTRGG